MVLYTPKNEHFGIVPVESMYCGAFVVAHDSGGPMESIANGKTGFRIGNENEEEWGTKVREFFKENNCKKVDEKILKAHVESLFSLDSMKEQFMNYLAERVYLRN